MKILVATLLALGGALGLNSLALAQKTTPEAALATSAEAIQQQYTNSFVSHPQLYNGPEYVDYSRRYHTRTGHQFFLTPERQPGNVYYNDLHFTAVPLAYDVVRDQVVLKHPTSPLTLHLINENVRSFTLNDHRFVRLVADSASRRVLRTGYYEVLAEGRVQVLAKRAKRQQEKINQNYVDVEFISIDRLYLQRAGRYYAISRKGAAMRLFADKAPEMQKFIRDRQLKFSSTYFEASLVELARHYNMLTAQ
ncbi:hypothetical protein LJY25_06050 [Hymenobacter sp. BT175]|uniref:hypothetical protein n=1 Tax=Hymenobacter translucens TaxID=2886507 RepID=UPI001D0E6B2E|nr:hypothetical protein [Hymenobacter translucens]MCC2546000.1 hypothetical protein [Hymenobacter translucens]